MVPCSIWGTGSPVYFANLSSTLRTEGRTNTAYMTHKRNKVMKTREAVGKCMIMA